MWNGDKQDFHGRATSRGIQHLVIPGTPEKILGLPKAQLENQGLSPGRFAQ